MPFFRNSAVNLLNLHVGIHAVATGGGTAFFLIYLVKSGVPVATVLGSIALILSGRFVLRPLVIGLTARCGLRRVLIAGTLLAATVFPLLAAVHGVGPALLALIVVAAIGDMLYWTSYHAYFAALGDDEHRGQQIGVREAAAAMVGVGSPIVIAWLLVAFGPLAAFGGVGLVDAASAIPLLWLPEVTVKPRVPGVFRTAMPAVLVFAADGCIGAGVLLVWQIVLFVALGESYLGYGSAVAVAALAGAVGGMTLGRHIDAGRGAHAVWLALGVMAAIVVWRAAAGGHPALAVLANAIGAVAYCLYIPTMMTPVYILAKQSPCTLRFHVAAEGGWDLGGAVTLLLVASGVALGMPLTAGVLLALAGVAASAVLLRRTYARLGVAQVRALATPGRLTGGIEPG